MTLQKTPNDVVTSRELRCPQMRNEFDWKNCDLTIQTGDGIKFRVHSKLFCEKSDFFRVMLGTDMKEKTTKECSLELVESDTFDAISKFVYKLPLNLQDAQYLPVLLAANFLHISELEEYCAAKIIRKPFIALEHELLKESIIAENYSIINILAELDLQIYDKARFSSFLKSTSSVDPSIIQSLEKKTRYKRLIVIYDSVLDFWLAFSGSHFFQYFEPSAQNLPPGLLTVAGTKGNLMYSTADSIQTVPSRLTAVNTESRDGCGFPPLLRQYGRGICWTEDDRRRIVVLEDGQHYQFKLNSSTIARHIAATDSVCCDNLVIAITKMGQWKVLIRKNMKKRNIHFEDLRSPLQVIECLAVIDEKIYIIGCRSWRASTAEMFVYENERWRQTASRLRNTIPECFFPLCGRLYVISANILTIEVYDPAMDAWFLDEFPEMTCIGGYFFR